MPRYSLRTLLILLAIGPPLIAAAWLWSRQLIADAIFFLMLWLIAATILVAVLAVANLVWEIVKGAVRLTRRALLRMES